MLMGVGSAKGGVGKTRISVAVARQLSKRGYKVGLVDMDINNSNVGDTLGVHGIDIDFNEHKLIPPEIDGMRVFTFQFLPDDDKAALFDGMTLGDMAQQFIDYVEWNDVEVLVLDMPPGTTEINQTLFSRFTKNDCMVLVTGPREEELKDAKRTIDAIKWYNIRLIGVVVNFSCVRCHKCNEIMRIGYDTSEIENMLGVNVISEIPLLHNKDTDRIEELLNIEEIEKRMKRKFKFFGG